MRGAAPLVLALAIALALAGCAGPGGPAAEPSHETGPALQASGDPGAEEPAGDADDGREEADEKEADDMRMSIGGTDVIVEWADNQAVADLRALAAADTVTVDLSMYGGFEQVGPLGASLTTSDVQMTTEPGDIVLYAGNQISVFYGPNSWAYTKLGHITDKTAGEMADLLGNGDVSITISIQ